jgi:hypothetical protein
VKYRVKEADEGTAECITYDQVQESLKKAQVENPINQMSLANILDNDAEWREKNGKQSA